MFKKISTCILLIYIFETNATIVRSCQGLPAPLYINFNDCEREPCYLPLEHFVKFEVAFKTTKFSNKLTQKAEIDIEGGTNMEYNLNYNECLMLVNGYCPLFKDEVLLYRINFPLFGFPPLTFTVTFKLLGDDDDIISCFVTKLLVS